MVNVFMQALRHQQAGRLEPAAQLYRAALRRYPSCAEAHHNLGTIYQARGQLQEAIAAYQEALRLKPDYADAHYNLGVVWQAKGHFDAAVRAYQTALCFKPDFVAASHNLGTVQQAQGNFNAALASYETVLHHLPDDAETQWNRALIWLAQGNLTEGWPAYEWRWHTSQTPRRFPLPLWDGTSLTNRTILITAEQGLGDELLFASCVPDVLAQAGHVVIECDPRLAPLFVRTFPTATVYGVSRDDQHWLRQAPPLEVYSPSGSLQQYLRPTLGSFPPQTGYLQPDRARQVQYRQRLAALGPGLKVGLAWRSIRARTDLTHYTALEQWAPLFQIPGIHIVNLQYDNPREELAAVQSRWGVSIHTWDDLDPWHDQDEMAALITALHLVIAPDIAVAQLAGSVGQVVWRLTAAAGSWTSLGTDGCPWFPNMRVFRQAESGIWNDVITQVVAELCTLATRQIHLRDYSLAGV